MIGKLKPAGAKFWSELKRRRVVKTTIAYAVSAWIVVEASATIFPALLLPEWTVRIVVATAILAFPLVVILAWFFDIERKSGDFPSAESDRSGENNPQQDNGLPPTLSSALSSVAVLPFQSLSQDENHQYIADGIAAELHSTLSLMHRLRVISRTSSFAYARAESDLSKIGTKLGAKFVISGSVQFIDNRMRVIVELDNATEDVQIWSETYDRELTDVFAVQHDIAQAVSSAFGGARLREEITAATQRSANLDAWTLVQKARSFTLEFTPRALSDAVPLLRKAIDIDEDYAVAHAALAFVLAEQRLNGISGDLGADRALSLRSADRAFELSPGDPFVLKMCGAAWAYSGQSDKSLGSLRHAVEIAPFDFGAWGYMGWSLVESGKKQDIDELHKVMGRMLQTAPRHSGVPYWLYHRSVAFTCEGLDTKAVDFARMSVDGNPEFPWGWMQYANALGQGGASDAARKATERAAQISSGLTPEHYARLVSEMSSTDEVARPRLAGLIESEILEL